MNTRLYRSRDDRIIAGVGGGIAESLNVDPSIVRILFAILVPLTGGLIILLYLVMAFIVPEQPAGDDRWAMWERQAAGMPDAPGMTEAPGMPATSATPGGTWTADSPSTAPADAMNATRAQSSAAGREWRAAAPEPDRGRDWEPARAEHRSGGGGGALVFGLILVLLGGFFLARSYIPNIDWDRSWPILLVVIGAVLLVGALRRASPGPR